MLSLSIVGRQWWWLLLWTILGASLRLANLDGKPPWSDEFRTLVVSAGNSFSAVPLDRVINIRDLLAPLFPNPSATIRDIVRLVSIEDRQPPIYFVLSHLWMQMFPPQAGLVNLWGARALAAAWGILTIPCVYICSYLTFRGQISANDDRRDATKIASVRTQHHSAQLIANFTAAMLALSPYGVFISQEARHYSLAILWVTISMNCLAIACRYLDRQQKLPIRLIIAWIVVNILGLGTHYLFALAIIAEIIALGLVWRWQARKQTPQAAKDRLAGEFSRKLLLLTSWRRLGLALVGTLVGGAIWWWQLASTYDRHIHGWLDNAPHKLVEVINPLFQIIGALISMLSLLLVEVTELPPILFLSDVPIDLNLPIVILSAIVMFAFFVWVTPMLNRGLKLQLRQQQTQIGTMTMLGFAASAIGLYLIISWLTGIDITRGARYHFVYFPAIIAIVGLGLASCWRSQPSIAKWVSGKPAVIIVLAMGLVSSIIVASNYGYHKYYRSEQIVPMIQQSAPIPVLIATTHNSLVQVGEMMGLAWQMQATGTPSIQNGQTQFLLAHQWQKFCDRDCATTSLLQKIVDRFAGSLDVWLVNFYAPVQLPPTCRRDKKFTKGVYGYQYQLYHCQPIQDEATS